MSERLQTIELFLYGFAAIVDVALLLVIFERINRGSVAVWLKSLVASTTLIHSAIFLRLMLADARPLSIDYVDRALVIAICAGLLVLPSAMLHAVMRLNRTGIAACPTPDPRYVVLYLPLGAFIMLLVPVIQIAIGLNLSVAGYRQGRSSIQNMLKSGRMQELITGASIMGLFMMGALSSTYVKLSTPLEWNFGHGNEPMVLQNIIDSIVPGLLPLAVVMAIYFWLGRKKQNIGLIAIVILAISLASAAIGLF